METQYDIIIIGSGIAGLSCALSCDTGASVLIASQNDPMESGSSPFAQGGIAFSENIPTSIHAHINDTLNAGAGLCDKDVVSTVIEKSHKAIDWLQSQGVIFDTTSDGTMEKCREAVHSESRIVHIGGDATGIGVVRTLCNTLKQRDNITFMVGGISALYQDNDATICGVDIDGTQFTCHAVIFATGGASGLFSDRTAPAQNSTAFKLAMDAGAMASDMEFFQYHPTALDLPDEIKPKVQRLPLISEAVRGHGAVLCVGKSELHIPHPDASLAPRDVVSRAVFHARENGKHVYLDTSSIRQFSTLFPTIANICKHYDINYRKIPVRTAVHYQIGGIKTSLDGDTGVCGLYVIGEAAATGLHGANRLASNSLLEACIMGMECATTLRHRNMHAGTPRKRIHAHYDTAQSLVQTLNTRSLGIVRSHDTLRDAIHTLNALPQAPNVVASQMCAVFALNRTESIGAHYRSDYPETKTLARQNMTLRDFRNHLQHIV